MSERDKLERWLDRHNHKMEFLRTLIPLAVLILQALMFMAFFNGKNNVTVVEKEVPVIVQPNCWDCHHK